MAVAAIFLASLAVMGTNPERSALLFTSEQCSACRQMAPLYEQLRSEGLPIQAFNSMVDGAAMQRWRVEATPTLIILKNGAEVDRILGTASLSELRVRLTRSDAPRASSTAIENSRGAAGGRDSLLGPNYPYLRSPSTSRANSRNKRSGPLAFDSMIGPNHPLYSRYHRPDNDGSVSAKDRPDNIVAAGGRRNFVNPLLKEVVPLPDHPESMAATVRIRVKRSTSDSVGTGTVIASAAGMAIVLTCGHLFQGAEPIAATVELFDRGEAAPLPAQVIDIAADRVDLALLQFRPENSAPKVRIRPRSEPLHERDPVFSIGCDHGATPSKRVSIISKLNRYLGYDNIEVAGASVQGRSGGGLFDAQGRLVGVCFAADDELDESLCVGLQDIHAHLEKNGLGYALGGAAP